MSGFSPEWLALREPADLAARSRSVLEACRATFAGRDEITICDIGAGTGASIRAFAEFLPPRQHWVLVDSDPTVLAAAPQVLPARYKNKELDFRFDQRDLAADPACWPAETDLVTASAFFDLVSLDWIARFVGALAERNLSLLATLTVDGIISTEPPHPHDTAIAKAFRSHQERDKGFGVAAGPWAGGLLAHYLRGAGYEISSGESPWRLDATQPALREEYLKGVVTAVRETGLMETVTIESWSRSAAASTVRVGHGDLFARKR